MAIHKMLHAPTDGRRVLVLCETSGYDSATARYVPTGTKWQECRYLGGKWQAWCGNSRITSTEHIKPLGWAPVPEDNE